MSMDFNWLTSTAVASSLLIFSNTAHAASATEVTDPYTDYPYRTIGRLESIFPDLAKATCTASSIGNQAIWTAGHCVYLAEHGGWATEVKFAPAYKDKATPFRWWSASDIYTTKTWKALSPLKQGSRGDFAGAILQLNDEGKTISGIVGWLGFRWGYPREQSYSIFGYPVDAANPNADPCCPKMFRCDGQSEALLPSFQVGLIGSGPEMLRMECDMGSGASGGPWITVFSPTSGQADFLDGNSAQLNTLNVLGVPLYQNDILSPYFDRGAKDFKDCLVEGKGCLNFEHQSLGLIARAPGAR